MTTNITMIVKRMFGRATMGVAAALFVALASVTAFASPAAASIGQCPDVGTRRVCMWRDINFGGDMFIHDWAVPGVCYSMPGGYNDSISSLFNRTGYYLYFYEHGGCSNLMGSASPGTYIDWLGSSNDKMSSYKIQ